MARARARAKVKVKAKALRRGVPGPHSSGLALLVLVQVLGCGPRARTPAELATTRPVVSGGADAGSSTSPDAAAWAAPPTSAPDPALARCLAAGDLHAVITLTSGTPDCSGIGHEHLVFAIDHAAAGAPERAYLDCMLGVGCGQLAGTSHQDGSVWVATLRPDARPARTVYCVALPATQAVVTCAVPVDSVAHGRRLLAAARDAR